MFLEYNFPNSMKCVLNILKLKSRSWPPKAQTKLSFNFMLKKSL